MVANPGGITSTLYDVNGAPLLVIYEFFDPTTYAMRDRTIATSAGTRTGALIVDNMFGRPQQVTATSDTGTVKTFNIPSNGRVLTAAQLAALPPPDGPITTIQDLAGIAPTLA
jgi:hypothetical protein